MSKILIPLTEKNITVNGFQKLESGLIFQWGLVTVPASATTEFNFPIEFPTAALNLQTSVGVPIASGTWKIGGNIIDKTKFHIQNTNTESHGVYWLAIGT